MSDRRTTVWGDPRFILQIVTFMVVQIASMLGGYQVLQTKLATMETTGAALTETARELKGNVAAIQSSVQAVTVVVTRLDAKVDSQDRELNDVKQKLAMADARFIAIERSLARMEVRGR